MRIVIVEDEVSIRRGLAGTIPKLGEDYQVVGEAGTGREGLELVRRLMPDLIILDIQMPEMDGLEMLTKLREEGNDSRAVVLTAYSDFSYAKRAIALSIDNYLLKPIKIPELKETLGIIAAELEKEQNQEQVQEQMLSLEQVIRGRALAELPADEKLNALLKARYGLEEDEPLLLFSVWLGKTYEEKHQEVVWLLESYLTKGSEYQSCIVPSKRFELVLTVLYRVKEKAQMEHYVEQTILPAIYRRVKPYGAFGGAVSIGMEGLPEAFGCILRNRKWSLSFPEGELVTQRRIEALELRPLKYPLELEQKIRQAVMEQNQEEFLRGMKQVEEVCRSGTRRPEEIRDCSTKLLMATLGAVDSMGRMRQGVSPQELVGAISRAVIWEEISEAFTRLYSAVLVEDGGEDGLSSLVRRARKMMEDYYSQGITLDELARRLGVTDEYLSTQFKKETGATFTETMRRYRIDKVKELLLNSGLKLNQIADMVGYSDPKYMSRVFKEETGMLPAEFRKARR